MKTRRPGGVQNAAGRVEKLDPGLAKGQPVLSLSKGRGDDMSGHDVPDR